MTGTRLSGRIIKGFSRLFLPARVPFLPRHLQIETTTHCGLDCGICMRMSLVGTPRSMPFERFCGILAQFRTLDSLNLQGFGEPLLHPRTADMVRFAKERTGAFVFFFTSGTLLDRARGEALLEAGLDEMTVSVDGGTPEALARVRPGVDLRRLCENVGRFIRLRDERGQARPQVVLRMTALRANYRSLPELLQRASELDVDRVKVVGVREAPGAALATEGQRLTSSEAGFLHAAVESFGKSSALPVQLDRNILRLLEPGLERKPGGSIYCDWAWRGLYIDVEGRAYPCCFAPYNGPHTPQDAFRRSPGEIINNPARVALRKALKRGAPIGICANCDHIGTSTGRSG